MKIPPAELAAIVAGAAVGALPAEVGLADRVANLILSTDISADTDAEGSKFLLDAVGMLEPLLGASATSGLRATSLYGVDIPIANALAHATPTERRILVFSGLQHLTYYYFDLMRVLEALQTLRPDAVAVVDGERMPEALAFSLAGFSILADAMINSRTPGLIHDMLGPRAQRDVLNGYVQATGFVLLHELGHLELGHASFDRAHSERAHFSLLEPQQLQQAQIEELEADRFAFEILPAATRVEFMPSIMYFFGAQIFLETFCGGQSASHPLAINRLGGLAQLANLPADDERIVSNWLQDRLRETRRLTKTPIGGLSEAMGGRLSVEAAYGVSNSIKAAVLSESGPLDSRL